MRIGNVEFRNSTTNSGPELIHWNKRESGDEYCYVICSFIPSSEGYFMQTIGDRYAIALFDEDEGERVKLMTRYAFQQLNSEFELKEGEKDYYERF